MGTQMFYHRLPFGDSDGILLHLLIGQFDVVYRLPCCAQLRKRRCARSAFRTYRYHLARSRDGKRLGFKLTQAYQMFARFQRTLVEYHAVAHLRYPFIRQHIGIKRFLHLHDSVKLLHIGSARIHLALDAESIVRTARTHHGRSDQLLIHMLPDSQSLLF